MDECDAGDWRASISKQLLCSSHFTADCTHSPSGHSLSNTARHFFFYFFFSVYICLCISYFAAVVVAVVVVVVVDELF